MTTEICQAYRHGRFGLESRAANERLPGQKRDEVCQGDQDRNDGEELNAAVGEDSYLSQLNWSAANDVGSHQRHCRDHQDRYRYG